VSVFVDTSAIYAVLSASDPMHPWAAEAHRQLVEDEEPLITTSYVVTEVVALLQARLGLDAALSFESVYRPRLDVVWVDEDLHVRGFRRLKARRRRRLSLVDCVSFVTMEERELRRAFAYDPDFAEEGFDLIGQPAGDG